MIYALIYGKELLDTGIEDRNEHNSNINIIREKSDMPERQNLHFNMLLL